MRSKQALEALLVISYFENVSLFRSLFIRKTFCHVVLIVNSQLKTDLCSIPPHLLCLVWVVLFKDYLLWFCMFYNCLLFVECNWFWHVTWVVRKESVPLSWCQRRNVFLTDITLLTHCSWPLKQRIFYILFWDYMIGVVRLSDN